MWQPIALADALFEIPSSLVPVKRTKNIVGDKYLVEETSQSKGRKARPALLRNSTMDQGIAPLPKGIFNPVTREIGLDTYQG